MPPFIPFPNKLKARLMELEQERINLIKGFMFSLDTPTEGRWSIADDLSGLHYCSAPSVAPPPSV